MVDQAHASSDLNSIENLGRIKSLDNLNWIFKKNQMHFANILIDCFLLFCRFRHPKSKNRYCGHHARKSHWTFRWKRRKCSKTSSSWTISIKCFWLSISVRIQCIMASGHGPVQWEQHQNIYLICHSQCQLRYRISAMSHQFYKILNASFASRNVSVTNNPTSQMWRWRHEMVVKRRHPQALKWIRNLGNMRTVNGMQETARWQWMWKLRKSAHKLHRMNHILPNHALHPVQPLETHKITSTQHQMLLQSGNLYRINHWIMPMFNLIVIFFHFRLQSRRPISIVKWNHIIDISSTCCIDNIW